MLRFSLHSSKDSWWYVSFSIGQIIRLQHTAFFSELAASEPHQTILAVNSSLSLIPSL